ncbi:hypothetical protein AMJ39_09705 [candidate division TA06 bacterium DG_24]|uniref:N-acetyltransferase domain-containing protein n=2 Tax=Bacteria division TA06 TaxID=1156500 RepID=A0A0S8J997_UNCT6|nr:MAG: hypothetical protein AMJ39_09705 [candidate division TA06 bacterium DG_24]KPL06319.1 MAG: hypothetical protein AMJ71_10025 [candidate division TA06 bacterium SM1_40]
MSHAATYLTAETEQGRSAIEEVMRRSYAADVENVPPGWAVVRVVDEAPVSFILVDPEKEMEFPGGDVRYGFIADVATCEDRRGEGHFREIVTHAFSRLRSAGIPIVVTHGRHQLYRQFGFDVFTYHSGIFITPDAIERQMGTGASGRGSELLVIDESRHITEGLLVVTEVRATELSECRAALKTAAAIARERGKARILFEHPAAPSYGSRYPMYASPETPFTDLARACGAQVSLQRADPERGSIPDADWIKVLDARGLVREVLADWTGEAVLEGGVCLDTDAGDVTVVRSGSEVVVGEERRPDLPSIAWPSSGLAQLVTGYRSAEELSELHHTSLPGPAVDLLDALFPRTWRFSRNESWTYGS